jgi:hypothetical protein
MKRQHYFPRLAGLRSAWFDQYATQLALANATLGLPAADVTDTIADARYCQHACGVWLTAVRDFGPAATSALDHLLQGEKGAGDLVLPVFVPNSTLYLISPGLSFTDKA